MDQNVNLQPGQPNLTSADKGGLKTYNGEAKPKGTGQISPRLGDISPTAITSQSVQSSPESDIFKNVIDNALAAKSAADFAGIDNYSGEAKPKGSGQISPRYDLNVNLQQGLGDITSPAQSVQSSPKSVGDIFDDVDFNFDDGDILPTENSNFLADVPFSVQEMFDKNAAPERPTPASPPGNGELSIQNDLRNYEISADSPPPEDKPIWADWRNYERSSVSPPPPAEQPIWADPGNYGDLSDVLKSVTSAEVLKSVTFYNDPGAGPSEKRESQTEADTAARKAVSGLVQVQVVADIHMPPPIHRQLASPAQPQPEFPALSQLDSPSQPQLDSPAQPQLDSPTQLQLDSPTQLQLDSPAQL